MSLAVGVGIGIALLVLALVLARAVIVVPAGHTVVVERLGRMRPALGPGLHLMAPLIDRVRARLPLGETSLPLPTTPCITLDNRVVDIDGAIRVCVADPLAALTEVADYEAAAVQAAATVVREHIGQLPYDAVRESSRELAARGLERTVAIVGPWGLQATALDIVVRR